MPYVKREVYQRLYSTTNYGKAEKGACPGVRYLPLYRDWLISPVIDLGCGTGDTVKALREEGFVANGIDQVIYGEGMRVGDITAPLTFEPTPKSALLLDVAEHIPDEGLEGVFQNMLGTDHQVISTFSGSSTWKGSEELHINLKTPKQWREFIERWFTIQKEITLEPTKLPIIRSLFLCEKKR
jgi:hypothetical protein